MKRKKEMKRKSLMDKFSSNNDIFNFLYTYNFVLHTSAQKF